MNKKRIEIILNIIIIVLTAVLAIVYIADGQWLVSAAFAVICILNIAGLFLRFKRQ